MALHRVLGLYDLVDAFVVPCHFMKTKLMEGGFQEKKIYIMRSPVSSSDNNPPKRDRNYMVYFGRISFEKGLETLIRGYQEMDGLPDLVLAGRSYDREQERLERIILPENRKRIRFVGFLEGSQLSELISGALFSVVPSNWYDNSPLSVYESFLHETPVLASDIGGISEQIQDGVTGRLFRPGSVENLKTSLSWMLSDRNRLREMGKAGKMFVRQECSWATHSDQLLSLFQRLIHSKRKKTCAE
jgi:glycosyltransferase involved in cell wall biosynthesis